jgi:hypothetical protein
MELSSYVNEIERESVSSDSSYKEDSLPPSDTDEKQSSAFLSLFDTGEGMGWASPSYFSRCVWEIFE